MRRVGLCSGGGRRAVIKLEWEIIGIIAHIAKSVVCCRDGRVRRVEI